MEATITPGAPEEILTALDREFFDIVRGIEELEDLQAPGWFSFNWFAYGTAAVGLFYVGVAIT